VRSAPWWDRTCPSASKAVRPGCAAAARRSSGSTFRSASHFSSHCRRSGCRRRRCTPPGTSSVARTRSDSSLRRRSSPARCRARQRPRSRGGLRRAPPGRLPCRARGGGGCPRDHGRKRFGVRGPGRGPQQRRGVRAAGVAAIASPGHTGGDGVAGGASRLGLAALLTPLPARLLQQLLVLLLAHALAALLDQRAHVSGATYPCRGSKPQSVTLAHFAGLGGYCRCNRSGVV
jgi:hypothetical protein